MDLSNFQFVIVGAGIGGLSTAVSLRQAGADVTVLEQADDISEIGAGLQISENGMCVLRALGLANDQFDIGVRSYGTEMRDYRAGRRIVTLPEPEAGPTFYCHRADLIDLLKDAAIGSGVRICLGKSVHEIRQAPGQVTVSCEDGTCYSADCVVAADGARSRVRALLSGTEQPRFSGQVAWRALVPCDPDDHAPARAVLTMGPGRHVVTYPLRDKSILNIVAVEDRSDWQKEGWRIAGDPDELRARFADFQGPAGRALASVEQTHLWGLFLRPVAAVWHDRQVVLLGDSAHPTLPFMAQGACLALEDAYILTRCFMKADGVAQALTDYQQRRQDRATKVVAVAASNAHKFHLRGPMRLASRLALPVIGPHLARRLNWIYRFDATA